MTRDEILNDFRERFKGDITGFLEKSPQRVYIDLKPEVLRKASEYLFQERHARFNIASGVDVREHMEILYHFTVDELDLTITLKVRLAKTDLQVDSLVPVFEAANWIEREIHELLGIDFKGHPDLRRLLLPDDWPEGVYPLRQDYKEWDKNAIRDRGV